MTEYFASRLDDEFGHARLRGVSSDAETLSKIIKWISKQDTGEDNTLHLDVPKLKFTSKVNVDSNLTIDAGNTQLIKAHHAQRGVITQQHLDEPINNFHWTGGEWKNTSISSGDDRGWGGDLFQLFGNN